MTTTPAGLRDVVVADSSICSIDGERGILRYRGIDIHELAAHASFEETAFLLWFGDLPNEQQLSRLTSLLSSSRELAPEVVTVLKLFANRGLPMEALRTAVSAMVAFDAAACDYSDIAETCKSVRLVAQTLTVVAYYDRLRRGRALVPPREDLGLAANFLYMLTGEEPEAVSATALDVALTLHAEHELNASTFAARVVAATLADIFSAVTSAIAALSGPLHGGANERVMEMLQHIGKPDKAERFVQDTLARHERIMGFGHPVYRTEDPRAVHLRNLFREVAEARGDTRWFEISLAVERAVREARDLRPNVDFFSAGLYCALGIPPDLFTPVFACSRMVGWTAHILEQHADNRLIRPRANYTGPEMRSYVPWGKREPAPAPSWRSLEESLFGES